MRTIKATFANGDTLTTRINGAEEEITAYYLGNTFDLAGGPQECTGVEFMEPEHKITLRTEAGNWMAELTVDGLPDPLLVRLFGSAVLPLPYTDRVAPEVVAFEIAGRNPGYIVTLF